MSFLEYCIFIGSSRLPSDDRFLRSLVSLLLLWRVPLFHICNVLLSQLPRICKSHSLNGLIDSLLTAKSNDGVDAVFAQTPSGSNGSHGDTMLLCHLFNSANDLLVDLGLLGANEVVQICVCLLALCGPV